MGEGGILTERARHLPRAMPEAGTDPHLQTGAVHHPCQGRATSATSTPSRPSRTRRRRGSDLLLRDGSGAVVMDGEGGDAGRGR
ncbi:hypothetical protein VT52_021340 [Streptomyces malaysiense]|uniref:Uncharacterized protein n=1 Tax=Streptomyces malaysiense TaxID=1428626 RepID=A0A1J4PXZ1_9ACTN|nr:hypothetical protein VT52_021340 [Streptomyces malaysiense]